MLNYSKKLIGYNRIFSDLVSIDNLGKLPPRILLSGLEGIGKSTFAFHFINYFLSKDEETKYDLKFNSIQENSISYNLINNLAHPNFYYVSKSHDKKYIETDQIRSMINFLNKSSFNNRKKIILIDGAENLNINSSNALLKSLEESNNSNLFILTHNTNLNLLDTIKSRCLSFKLSFDYSEIKEIILHHFDQITYDQLNNDFKFGVISPKFLLEHVFFIHENKLDLSSFDAKKTIQHIVDNKLYKKNIFISENFQRYVEIYLTKMYSKTKNYKYYDYFLKIIEENNLIKKFNLDQDSFFIKFQNKYLNI